MARRSAHPWSRRSIPPSLLLAALGGCDLAPGEPGVAPGRATVAAPSAAGRAGAAGGPAPGRQGSAPGAAPVGAPRPAPVERGTPSSSAAWIAEERLTGGATAGEALPLVVALHGLGDRPERFLGVVDGFPGRARVLAPRAFAPWGDGFSWFPFRPEATPEQRATAIAAAVDALAPLIERAARERPTRGKPVVFGFSQGGMLSYALAVRHPGVAAAVIPLSGALPAPLWPTAGARVTPVFAFHGRDDARVPAGPAEEAVQALRARGATATLTVFPGVGHEVPPVMRDGLFERLSALLGSGGP